MSQWITDRRPINDDEEYVFNQFGDMVHYLDIKQGEPWMRIERPEPYLKPNRFKASFTTFEGNCVIDTHIKDFVVKRIPTREAAERIAAIYNKVLP